MDQTMTHCGDEVRITLRDCADLTTETSAIVDDAAPEGTGFPPARIGGVVAEAHDQADHRAIERQGQVAGSQPLPAEEVVAENDSDIPEYQEQQWRANVGQHAPDMRPFGQNHGAGTPGLMESNSPELPS